MNKKNIYINFAITMSLILALSIGGFSVIRAYELKAIMSITDDQQNLLQIKNIFGTQINIIVMCVGIVACQFLVFYLYRDKGIKSNNIK